MVNNGTIKVKILADGKTAKEMNPLGEYFEDYESNFGANPLPICFEPREELKEFNLRSDRLKRQYDQAEAKLRTFEIELFQDKYIIADEYKELLNDNFVPDTIHSAEILDNGKIKIL